ncbi:class A beta-lactamase-related serine hydrolase [Streptomyces platensis]|uniref:Class A beta-lactamase-related serine hydrolase n=1 Tax=Streptomyces platensis TaxID=58346 RepID=A0AAE6NIP1_STRPT|nr:serine hydrolase domain-containing protein [Streptomyces platensis]OSY37782.1 D-alanyl-D-alanine carboxypeptidase precursor [Streptomyces platensis]QEV53804.1 class A beta-lactamase-related serine hydrolase [Streptomyces platensis]
MRAQTGQSLRSSTRQGGRRRRAVSAAVAVAIGVMTLGSLAPPAASADAAARPDAVQQALNTLVRDDGMPAALASVQGRNGRTRSYTAGVGDLTTGSKVPRDGQVRIGSNTKAFTAVVVLQLVGEGKIDLKAFVDTYLPGLVRGEGIDGRRITVRHLLQHTSGLPDYGIHLDDDEIRNRHFEPRELLDLALRHRADAAPGETWGYSNTNYILAGLIVEKVTGRPLAEEMDRRIIKRIGLRHTYFPAPGEMTIREPHPRGYHRSPADGPLRDFTEMDPSAGWAAGQVISTNSDLNRFFTALLAGRLLPAAQLAEMRTTIPAGTSGLRYGLGLTSRPLSCGGVYWGHGGDIAGYETRGGVTDDGRAANVAVTSIPTDKAAARHVNDAVDRALCG